VVELRPVIFLGPSLDINEAISILDADYKPPVKRGDLLQIPQEVEVVGIVDGLMLTDAAVGHREILSLLDRGVSVFGGGSMGALRAAELADMGMVGVGRIFEEYSSGRVEGDDEVVLSFDPFTQAALSEPLINLRLNLIDACERGIITPSDTYALIRELKKEFYPRRSYEKLFYIANNILLNKDAQVLEEHLRKNKIDFKRNDAILLINAVKAVIEKN
jgi:hypothetical protein